MTNEQINAAIAKVLKYKQWYPNFATDLNAMHEAENTIKGVLMYDYAAHISSRHDYDELLTATARQRAEAFLRTLGKWEEGE
jgi:hypothetical protein